MAEIRDDAAVRKLASEILARPEYARFRTRLPDWLAEAWDWFRSLFTWLEHLAVTAPALFYALVVGLLLLAVLLIAHLVWTIRAALRTHAPAPIAGRRAQRDLAAEAAACAARGAYLDAAHGMLLATLAHVAQARLLELRPEDSNRVVRAKLRRARLPGGLQQRLIALIDRTEAAWFGSGTPSPELYAEWRAVYLQLQAGGAA